MIRRIAAGLGACVVGAVVLAGCGGAVEPEPSAAMSVPAVVATTPSPSVSPSPTVTEEERLLAMIPDAAKGDDLPAAVEMAKFFIQLHPGLFMGVDPALFEFLSLPSCMFCSSSVRVAREMVSSGRLQEGGEMVIPEQVPISVQDIDAEVPTALVQLYVIEEAFESIDGEGTVLRAEGDRGLTVSFELRFEGDLWRVSGVGITYD